MTGPQTPPPPPGPGRERLDPNTPHGREVVDRFARTLAEIELELSSRDLKDAA